MKTEKELINEGLELLKDQKYKEACNKFQQATEINPNSYFAFCNWGNALLDLSKLKETKKEQEDLLNQAIKKYERAIDINSYIDVIFYNLGEALSELSYLKEDKRDLLNQAIEKYQRAIEINPNYDMFFSSWGVSLSKLSMLKEVKNEKEDLLNQAIKKYERAIEINPDNDNAFVNWGVSLLDLSELKETKKEKEGLLNQSIKKYERAIEINPDNDNTFVNWGVSLSKLSELKETKKEKEDLLNQAIKKYERAIEINPDNDNDFANWGNTLLDLSKLKETKKEQRILLNQAIEKFQRAIEVNPENDLAYLYLSICYNALKQYSLSLNALNMYLYLISNFKEKVQNLAIVVDIFSKNTQPLNVLTLLDIRGFSADIFVDSDVLSVLNEVHRKDLGSLPLYYFLDKEYAEDYNPNVLIKSYFQDSFELIKDFLYLSEYYIHTQQIDTSWLAVLYFYLGGIVKSYKLYKEVLNTEEDYQLTSRDYYYYAKCTEFISLEQKAILDDCIEKCPQNSDVDLYYLGHLYWIKGDSDRAVALFEQSKQFKYSNILFEFLTQGKLENNIERSHILFNIYKDELDANGHDQEFTDKEIFEDFESKMNTFFYLKECSAITNPQGKKLLVKEMWEYFTINTEHLYLKRRQFEMSFIEKDLSRLTGEELSKADRINNGVFNEHRDIIKFLKKEVKNLKNKVYDKPNLKSIEDLIAHQIQQMGDRSARFYTSIVVYYYQEKDIDEEQAFKLLAYLSYTISKKSRAMTEAFLFELVSSYLKVGKLLQFVLKAYHLSEQYQKQCYNTSETMEYKFFKDGFWKYISYLKETQSQKDFEKSMHGHL